MKEVHKINVGKSEIKHLYKMNNKQDVVAWEYAGHTHLIKVDVKK